VAEKDNLRSFKFTLKLLGLYLKIMAEIDLRYACR